jgi:hypothetical protein
MWSTSNGGVLFSLYFSYARWSMSQLGLMAAFSLQEAFTFSSDEPGISVSPKSCDGDDLKVRNAVVTCSTRAQNEAGIRSWAINTQRRLKWKTCDMRSAGINKLAKHTAIILNGQRIFAKQQQRRPSCYIP